MYICVEIGVIFVHQKKRNQMTQSIHSIPRTQAQISRAAIQRLYVSMRHLILRGSYKPLGVSGESMIEAMLLLKPEIYGSVGDEEKVELEGLLYIFQRLPRGIEQCRYIKLISREGFDLSHFEKHVPPRRKRDCYRVDEENMVIEMTRGGSDIYDILTHLTFMYIEAEKIRRNSLDARNRKNRSWLMLEKLVSDIRAGREINTEVGFTYLNTLLGRTYQEVSNAYLKFEKYSEHKDILKVGKNNLKIIVTDKITNEKKDVNIQLVVSKTITADSDMALINENFQNSDKIYIGEFELKEADNWILTGSFTVDGIVGYIYIETNAI